MHSLAGLVHADFRIPALDYDDILVLTYDLTKSIAEVEKAYRLACFNILAHNKDSHA
jgi:serine/threonine-protein kinase HipA